MSKSENKKKKEKELPKELKGLLESFTDLFKDFTEQRAFILGLKTDDENVMKYIKALREEMSIAGDSLSNIGSRIQGIIDEMRSKDNYDMDNYSITLVGITYDIERERVQYANIINNYGTVVDAINANRG